VLRFLVIMSPRFWTLTLWFVTLLLFLALAWSLYLAAFNWWAGSGPPTEHPEIYRMHGNVFFGAACGFLLAFVISLWSLIRRSKRPL
jgi:hypothetical protein